MSAGRDAPPQRALPVLADVARLSGVSEITVSRVIRNKGPISDKTRERVLHAVAETGYVPNRLAGALASADSMLVGVVLPSVTNIVFADVLRGIHEALAPAGYQPVVGVTGYDADEEERAVRSLLAWQPAAIILAGFEHTEATRRMLAASRIRVAEIMDIDATPIDVAVGLSHRSAGRDIARYLLSRGYRRFGYVGHDWDSDHRARLRFEGLTEELAAQGLALVAERRIAGPSSTLAGRETLAGVLATGERPDVVVFSNDDMAVGGYFHCLAAGLVPRHDIGLFGFNGLEIGAALPLRLSTVRSNRFLIGKLAAEALVARPDRPADTAIINTGYEIEAGETA
ncbi:transcriptional regulator, LacI family [Kaistia soli DSM 19436]|uniref:Transcriptional regulator, LacI family n=1 Tax=Kaistia soli DSM 19436 TaxID=1122133 RepID=A0A1M5IWN4_9HYPH|nr:LacI family DNA-binding transcriptional regulator [Kaistia soli]SHG32469.1 transcriptional regulator, LacI family [Kaistia soli DSM 19436]